MYKLRLERNNEQFSVVEIIWLKQVFFILFLSVSGKIEAGSLLAVMGSRYKICCHKINIFFISAYSLEHF